jgi:thioredoxin 1
MSTPASKTASSTPSDSASKAAPAAVSDADFQTSVMRQSGPVLVDFWASWCEPCKALKPVIDQLATEFAGRLKVVTVDVDASPLSARAMGVRGLPTLVLLRDGKPVGSKTGALSKAALVAWLTKAL